MNTFASDGLKRIILSFCLIFTSLHIFAQTDVTASFLVNYHFDNNFDYTKDRTDNVAQEIRDIKGWTRGFSVDYTITGVYEFGFKGKFNNGNVPESGYNGEKGGGLALSTGWGVDFTLWQNVTLPAGEYTITVPTYNGYSSSNGTSLLAWIPQSGTVVRSNITSYPYNKWTLDKISFTLSRPTTGKLQIGYKAAANGSVNSANLIIDYVRIEAKNMGRITEQTSFDATGYIANPSFETGGVGGWKSDGMWTQGNSEFKRKSGNTYVEYWVPAPNTVPNCGVSQKVSLPLGKYKLTVGAHNLLQSSLSKSCGGVYVYAGDKRVAVGQPDDYTLTFTNTTGEVEIGYSAVNAEGNWIAVDNFRLQQIDILTDNALKEDLAATISIAKSLYDSRKNGAADLLMAINSAQSVHDDSSASVSQTKQAQDALDKAILQFRISNSTPGTGTLPSITSTHDYVPTGATEALVRASASGSNILEQGVCWSKEHNPTVLDNRTTKVFSLNGNIYHIKGLEPATVYYVRPYVMNRTYTVAYGNEIKIVTHPQGNCIGTWNEGAPTEEANARCRNAISETIEYFNEWTGIRGFTLTGNYGSGTPTADCSYGGWMRIGPNAGNQAIGTVIHETGHGVGVGTSARWSDTNVHNWKWFGREANRIYSFLENKTADPYNSEFCMVGDKSHGWGQSATFDWFVNGADKDRHNELQYIGGCCLLYGMFIDGLCPTTAYSNGIAGYTFNFDDSKKYYIMNKDAFCGLGSGLLVQSGSYGVKWTKAAEFDDKSAWYIKYEPGTGMYSFVNASSGKALSHANGITLTSSALTANECFQLMPDRTDVTVNGNSVHGYWFTWNGGGNKSMSASSSGAVSQASFDYADTATAQQWIIISEDDLPAYNIHITPEYILGDVNTDKSITLPDLVETINAILLHPSSSFNPKYADMNADGRIDMEDVKRILDIILNR